MKQNLAAINKLLPPQFRDGAPAYDSARFASSGGVYSRSELLDAYQAGHILIHPFIESNVKGSSVDVTLGYWFHDAGFLSDTPHPALKRAKTLDWTSQEAISSYFQLKKAIPHHEACEKYDMQPLIHIAADFPVIPLLPRQRILAHTHEFIGINPPGTTEMKARSSWGRLGIFVCVDAGWGDPGYRNRWTMEIHNSNDFPTVLPVGERVAQIIFHYTGDSGHYADDGKYQTSKSVAEMVADWKPESMTPRNYKDQRVMPLPAGVPIED